MNENKQLQQTLQQIKLDLAIILCLGIIILLVISLLTYWLWQLEALIGYCILATLWLIVRIRIQLNPHLSKKEESNGIQK